MEKEKIKNITKLVIAVFIGLGIGYSIFKGSGDSSPANYIGSKASDSYVGSSLNDSPTIACTFERTTTVIYENNTIIHETPNKETTPIVFFFLNLNTNNPKLKSVGSNNIVYESDVMILGNTPDKIVLGEITPLEKNVFIYTIYKNTGVGIWTKQYEMFGTPLGLISMGKCSSNQ